MSGLKAEMYEDVMVLWIDRPEAGHSFGIEEAKHLVRVLKKLPKDCIGLLWTSAPDSHLFCSGGDLKDFAQSKSAAKGRAINKEIRKALQMLAELPIPTVAAVGGDCFGGGMEILSCFDRVLSESHILFGFWQRRIGLSFGWGGGTRWLKRISESRLKQLSLDARNLTASQALHLGLIDEICPEANLWPRAIDWIHSVFRSNPVSFSTVKFCTPANETRSFEKLWWNPVHRRVLSGYLKRR